MNSICGGNHRGLLKTENAAILYVILAFVAIFTVIGIFIVLLIILQVKWNIYVFRGAAFLYVYYGNNSIYM